jgi:hypothetical protein
LCISFTYDANDTSFNKWAIQNLAEKDKDIINAISDVESAKRELKRLRTNEGFNSLMNKVHCFCRTIIGYLEEVFMRNFYLSSIYKIYIL